MAGAADARASGPAHADASVGEPAEIALTQELYPWARDYTDVYERYGLLGAKSLFGHCIHLSDREADALSAKRLGGGVLPDLEPVPRLGPVRLPALSPARQAAQDRHRHRCRRRHQLFDAAHHGRGLQGDRAATARSSTRWRSFWQITRGNAEALSMADRSARWSRAPTPTSWCSMPRQRRRWRLRRSGRRRWRRSCSCCRRWATTGRCATSMSPGGRPRARRRRARSRQ